MADSSRAAATVEPTGNPQIDGLLTGAKWQQDASGGTTTITYSFPLNSSQYDGYAQGEEPSNGFLQLTAFQQNYFRGLLDNLEQMTNLRFVELSGARAVDATVRVGWTEDNDEGTVAWAYIPENSPYGGDVWLNAKSFSPTSTTLSDNEVAVLMHEFGHALGLKHPHETEGSFGALPAQWDGPEYTSLTYNFSADYKDAYASDLYPQTFMWLDIQVLQHMYGKNMTASAGNETYAYDLSERHYLTIWDAGGTDTLKVTNGSKNVDLDLTPGSWSDVGTVVTFTSDSGTNTREKTVYIAPDTIIENAEGADGNDRINGNDAANVLKGNAGNDSLTGGAGADRLVGGAGDDEMKGGSGNDKLWAGSGDAGNDKLTGGTGNDVAAGGAGNDVIAGGSDGTDVNSGSDTLFGGAGDDTLMAGSWNDSNNNGRYDAGEHTAGNSSDDDSIWAGSGSDHLIGGAGDDKLGGGTGGDTIEGGAGDDKIYGGKASAESGADNLSGGEGDDTIFAGDGGDTVSGDSGDDRLFGGSGSDTLSGGDGDDRLFGGTGDDALTGGAGADRFLFASGHGDDTVTDFSVAEDDLVLTNTATDFSSLADVQAAATDTTQDGQSGLLINTGGGDSIFLIGIEKSDLTNMDIAL